ncbi:MAG TPA: polysaccharide biosynthesis protein, partial [Phycisphaerales bacterium]|nr:polysaccharide biosynthesis protein [Phycisphaerales bacterium]
IIAGRRPPAEPGMSRVAEYTPLIGRTPYGIDRRAVSRVIEGRRVLITGAGGSIGSEIARIVAGFAPSAILLMDRSENALFEVNRRIGDRFPGLDRRAILHDVVDAPGTRRHLHSFEPHVVFHAAAHKHVPLMEDHPYQAVANNFYGTRSIADAALACGAERFVLISSDKAVKPTSVMGATKRLAEMYTQALHRSVWSADGKASAGSPPRTAFCMVRFGNVLGSACSVLPIWSSQVAEGGPVTVTDTRMTRYFMTIEEAAALVIQAGAIDTTDPTAHVYVLDMGRPVRILDLARRFVRSMGFWPDVQDADGRRMPEWIPEEVDPAEAPMIIRITGARPGEKLHEELAYAAELVKPTPYAGINAWAGPTTEARSLDHLLNDLSAITPTSRREDVVEVLRRYVPELPERKIDANQNTNTPAQSAGNADLKPNIEPVTA